MSALTLKIRETYTDLETGKTKTRLVASVMQRIDAAALVALAPKTRSVVYNGKVLWSPRQSAVQHELQNVDGHRFLIAVGALDVLLDRAIDNYWAARRRAAGLQA